MELSTPLVPQSGHDLHIYTRDIRILMDKFELNLLRTLTLTTFPKWLILCKQQMHKDKHTYTQYTQMQK